MHIKIDKQAKRCEIWISNEERPFYKNQQEYLSAVNQFGKQGYGVCVYVGGVAPLLPNISALIAQQETGFKL